ncbi:hypothetical protein V7S43_004796 [Phytophthora oleae]|uniref:Uncharacterized protein n=1 Tax=Phytophthora oleae TaxID=2107226 RepID=A0ABD3FWY1_9STRA
MRLDVGDSFELLTVLIHVAPSSTRPSMTFGLSGGSATARTSSAGGRRNVNSIETLASFSSTKQAIPSSRNTWKLLQSRVNSLSHRRKHFENDFAGFSGCARI